MYITLYYIYPAGKDMNNGHGKKIISQCIKLAENGQSVKLFLIIGKDIEGFDHPFITKLVVSEMNQNNNSNIISKIIRQLKICKLLIYLIESASSTDIVYMRYPFPLIYTLWPFYMERRICKIVSEHNTIEPYEFGLLGNRIALLADFLMGNSIRYKIDGMVGVTNEITSYEIIRSGDSNKPHITIGNGIEVNKVKLRKPPIYTGEKLQILCVASFLSRWHGFDRLLSGLALYRGSTKVHISIVGDGHELPKLRQKVKDLKLEDIVDFTGFMRGSAFDDLFDKSHIAVGSLALHRMDMKEASVLKARDYCARGIPFLYGCSDPDFSDNFYYIQKVPGDESPINVEDIIIFAEKIYSDPEHHIKMRAYAEANLDWTVKMKKLKEFCEALVKK